MFQIDNSSASVVQPTPEPPGPKPDAFFTEGNPGGGIPATIVTGDWANSVQQELESRTTRQILISKVQHLALAEPNLNMSFQLMMLNK